MTPYSYSVRNQVLHWGPHPVAPLDDLTRNGSATIPPSRIRQWRHCAHNLVVHPLYGDAITLVTDGIHVVLDLKDGHCVEVAKTSLIGPVDRNVTPPADWDWDRNCRRVHVFKRKAPAPPAIIPVNTWMDSYWEVHQRLDQYEHLAYAAIADAHGPAPTEFQRILDQLYTAAQLTDSQQTEEKSRRNAEMNSRVMQLLSDL